jgi:DNA replication protein DnaC
VSELNNHLEEQLRVLKLKGILACYQDLSDRAGRSNLSYEEYLSLLFEEEIKRKNEGTVKTKINKARFPFLKTFYFLARPGSGSRIWRWPWGLKMSMAKHRVVFATAQKLLEELALSLKEGSFTERLLSYSRLNLLIIDELGYMPINKEQANLLFRLISMRYEKGSIILTSNYNFDEWGVIFSDQVVAAAIQQTGSFITPESFILTEQVTG